MRIAILVILLTFIVQTCAREPAVANATSSAQESTDNSADNWADEFLGRALTSLPLHRADLENTTIGKPAVGFQRSIGIQAIPGGARHKARSARSCHSIQAQATSADCPSVIVGCGRIGSLLASLGVEGDVIMRRGDDFPQSPATGPIYVTTRNNDLEGVIQSTPEHRRKDLVFMQNGMLGKFLEEQGLAGNTQVLLYLAVAKLGEAPIDGITDLNPDGLTAANGEWGAAFADRLSKGGLKCSLLEGDNYKSAMLEKHVWICSFMMVGALNGGVTVGEVAANHSDELRPLVEELCAAGEEALGVTLSNIGSCPYDRLAAYGQSVAHFPTAVKEFEWRNGWFYEITRKALAAGKPDPMPLHTAGLKKLGVVSDELL